MEMCETEQKAVLHRIEDLPLIAHIPECEFLPWVLKHADQLRSGGRQPMDLFQSFLALRGERGWRRDREEGVELRISGGLIEVVSGPTAGLHDCCSFPYRKVVE
jgi:hypothetical protein